MTLREVVLSKGPLLADGATGTMLQKMGLPPGHPPEKWNLDNPDPVRHLACTYGQAGSDLVFTNTFGANRIRLARFGLARQVGELNRQAVRLAQEGATASGKTLFIVGSVGPTGELLEPYGDLEPKEAQDAFAEQCEALASSGVDGIVGETFTDLQEAVAFVRAAREVTSLPIFVSLSFEKTGRTVLGVDPIVALQQLTDEGALVVGANCGDGIEPVSLVIRQMRNRFPDALLLAKPNAGIPIVRGTELFYPATPDDLAQFASEMKSLAVTIIGGCCGTTPDHIAAMSQILKP
ncbi:MAG: homocysteine S-methyltransferase family protein [Armatimonadetes bacterium]|nr:homocysteine S-methyltransferase family protein [Armatimonadota bacterium]MDW8122886.1 homocysteine S-methyltransferase family protein [Armatimonadota bacterium]